VQQLVSYSVNKEKKLSNDAEIKTAFPSVDSNSSHYVHTTDLCLTFWYICLGCYQLVHRVSLAFFCITYVVIDWCVGPRTGSVKIVDMSEVLFDQSLKPVKH